MKGDRYLKGQEFAANLTCHIIAIDCRFSLSQKVDKTDLSFSPSRLTQNTLNVFFSLSCNTLIIIAYFSFSKTKKSGKIINT